METLRKLIRWLLVFVVVIMISPLQVQAATLSEDEFANKIAYLKTVYRDKEYWNAYNTCKYEGTGPLKCSCSTSCAASCSCQCGKFYLNDQYYGGQCFGFANKMGYLIFGSVPTANWTKYTSVNDYYAGDYVRIRNDKHSIFITGVSGDTITYVDCNNYGPCQVKWDRTISKSELKSITTHVYHYQGNTLTGTITQTKDFISCVDYPTSDIKYVGDVYMQGWALYGGGVSEVVLYVNDKPICNCERYERTSVANTYPGYPTGSEGFRCNISAESFNIGENRIFFKAYTNNNSQILGDFGHRTITYLGSDPEGTQTISDGDYHIVSAVDITNMTKCLNVAGDSSENGINIWLWDSLDNPKQVFNVTYLGDGYYKIINKSTGKSLDIDGGSNKPHANLQQWDYTGVEQQQWIVKPASNDIWFNIISRKNGMYIDVDNAESANGTNVKMYFPTNSEAQMWRFVRYGADVGKTIQENEYFIASALDSTKTVSIKDNSTEINANVELGEGLKQPFKVEYLDNGYYKIVDPDSGLVMSFEGDKATSGTNIRMEKYSGGHRQQWILEETDDGDYYIVSRLSGLYLDVENGNSTNGANIQVWIGNKSNAQKWKFIENDTENPVISDIKVTNVTSDGYTISCTVTDNVEVDRVQFPTWTSDSGQDDIFPEWSTNSKASGTKNGNTYTYQVYRSEHNGEGGEYVTHIYAYDKNGNFMQCEGTTVTVPIEVEEITLDKTSITFDNIGETETIHATLYPSNVTTSTITWKTADAAVATVDNGLVKAVGYGTTTITAMADNGVYNTCEVTVKKPAVTSKGSITVESTTAKAGETIQVAVKMDENPGIVAARLQVSYDSNLLTLVKAEDKGILGEAYFGNNISNVPYILMWENGLASSNYTATGTLAVLTFKVSENAGDCETAITISYDEEEVFDMNNQNVAYDIQNGTISIKKNAGSSAKNPFTDVPESMYYYQPVLWALENNITAGLTATEFAPDAVCTRGQVVTFLWRAMGQPNPVAATNPFVDVNSSQYYYKAVLWALENNITAGLDATHFAPDATVTRGQFVTFLHRMKQTPSYSVGNPFVDVPSNMYYTNAVLWALENNVTAGLDATHFAPDAFCTRGQVVTFLYRALN